PAKGSVPACPDDAARRVPGESGGGHLFGYRPGWTENIKWGLADPRLPAPIREFSHRVGCGAVISTPLLLGNRTLGWMTLGDRGAVEPDNQWWRVVLLEAISRQAA